MKKVSKLRLFYISLSLLFIFVLTACHIPDNNKGELEGEDNSHIIEDPSKDRPNEIINEYKKLLEENSNKEDIIKFLDENISEVTREEASSMIIDLEEYLHGSQEGVYESYLLMGKYRPYLTLEIKSYISILATEASRPYIAKENINLDPEDLLERIWITEDHILIFSHGRTREKIAGFYRDYILILVKGLEDRNILTSNGTSIVKDDIIDLYKSGIKEEEGKGISHILSLYMDILEKNNFDLTSQDVKEFHKNLEALIQSQID